MDRSNGWEAVAPTFIRESHRSTVGLGIVRAWADALPPGAAVLDLGCGPGSPRSDILAGSGFSLYALDAAPSLADAYRTRFPDARVVCEPAEESSFCGERFDGVMAWGLLFLLPAETQREIIRRVAGALQPAGRFLFTAPAPPCTWDDLSTARPSLSLGADAYKLLLADVGLTVIAEHDDEGENHYFSARKL